MLRKASRAWGIAPARRSPENLPLAAFLHGDHPFGFESPVKSFLNEKKSASFSAYGFFLRKERDLEIFAAQSFPRLGHSPGAQIA
ncbi:hypothetical protein [Allofournierella massiliensis]|uniref:hypothetical protein n=1 Tax=Allofournierella massiliensis TaxID=1650663 RepID=UPI00104A8A10|nr:hypothetical protein [Fournierella massiliensis]